MDTLKSADEDSRWIATALVYSGRRNPSWRLEKECVLQLEMIWGELAPYLGESSRPDTLGYNGCMLIAPECDQWLVYGEVVTRTQDDMIEARSDPDRRFEKTVLSSAPAQSLPPWVPGQMT